MPDVPEALIRALSGRYTVDRLLGRGGMSTVYLGEDLRHRRQVAIKVLNPEVARFGGHKRFSREIQTVAALNHPHILPLYDSGQLEDLAYFVMPYVEGESLLQRLQREGQLTVDGALRITREVADGLDHAHRHGCVHRDIKPANILLSEGHAVIADFGVSRAIQRRDDDKLTASGFAVGTPAYLSPEQAGGEEHIDGRSDIYALGCVTYEMLSGEPPFTGPSVQAVIAKHVLEHVPSLDIVRPGIPPHIAAVIEKALAKRPADRFATAGEFAAALARPDAVPTGQRLARRTSRALPLGAAAVALAAVGVTVFGLAGGDRYVVDNPRRQLIVLAHDTDRLDPEERELAREAEDELTRLLTGWNEARVVPTVAKAGLMFDLGLTNPLRATLRESVALAREARVGTLVALSLSVRNDTARLEGVLVDVATGELVGSSVVSSAPAADVFALVAPVAAHVLDVGEVPEQLRTLRRESSNVTAVRHVQDGRRHLEAWRLVQAERDFRTALAEDSTFARAHYFLALTLYWQAARDGERLPLLGGAIRRHAAAARRHGESLVYRDSLFVEAFFAFQNGDFDASRTTYRDLVRTDSTDTYAWLMLGSVEYQDLWAEETADGRLRPRGDLNLARRAFARTVRLSPDFFLGYGHLFDIYQRLSSAIRRGSCYGYEPPGEELILIWETRDPNTQVYFCPVFRDSIAWVDGDELAGIDGGALRRGSQQFLNEALVELQRWSAYAPENPAPLEELANWYLAQRDLLPDTEGRQLPDSLARLALEHAERALALTRDTTPGDLARIGGLLLATGDLSRATNVTARALEAARGRPDQQLPGAAVNAFLATGQVSRALEVAIPIAETQRLTVRDAASGTFHPLHAEAALARLRVYGATGLGGGALRAAFADMERAWTRAGYREARQAGLRQTVAGWIAPAVTLDSTQMLVWFPDRPPEDPALAAFHHLYRGDSAAARGAFDAALERRGRDGLASTPAYLMGQLAERLGDPQLALQFYRQLDDWRLPFTSMRDGWGLQTLSHLRRAAVFASITETDSARHHYDRFIARWAVADSVFQPSVRAARTARAPGR